MAEDFDTSWFDLKSYDEVKRIGLIEWRTQIDSRVYASDLINADNEDLSEELKDSIDREAKRIIELIKVNPILEVPPAYSKNSWNYDSKYPFNTHSVFSTSALSIWGSANIDELGYVWECCKSFYDTVVLLSQRDEDQMALINTPVDLFFRERDVDFDNPIHNVSINLEATDEQIMTDFRHWLTEYRNIVGYKSRKKNFTDKDLAEWTQWRLLPYIDLMLAAAIEKRELTQPILANLIFCDEYVVGIVDRLRRTTIPKAKWLLRHATVKAIDAQLYSSA